MTPSGKLREQVTLQAKNLIDNGRGGRTRPPGGPEWTDIAEGLWAEIVPIRGGEALAQGLQRSVQVYRVTIRRFDGITPAHRLVWEGVGLNIKTVAMSTDRADHVMTCESGVPA